MSFILIKLNVSLEKTKETLLFSIVIFEGGKKRDLKEGLKNTKTKRPTIKHIISPIPKIIIIKLLVLVILRRILLI